MTILIFDREEKKGKALTEMLRILYPEKSVKIFSAEKEIEAHAGTHIFNVVFFCLSKKKKADLRLSERLLSVIPGVNLIFAAEDDSLMADALRLHASGYMVAPFDMEKVESEMHNLLYPPADELPVIRVESGKDLNIYIDERPLNFKYEKTKELFSLLLEMDGAMISTGYIRARLWDDDKSAERSGSYLQNLRADLKATLENCGMEGIIGHRRGRMWVDKRRFTEEKEDIFQ